MTGKNKTLVPTDAFITQSKASVVDENKRSLAHLWTPTHLPGHLSVPCFYLLSKNPVETSKWYIWDNEEELGKERRNQKTYKQDREERRPLAI